MAALAAVIEIPGLSQFFGCTPLGPLGWGIAVGTSLGASLAAEHLPNLVEQAVPAVGWLGAEVSHSQELITSLLARDEAAPTTPAAVAPLRSAGD
ncbi:MAG: hypothetical protein R2726_15615 [Acidimicrobiales bacterium]